MSTCAMPRRRVVGCAAALAGLGGLAVKRTQADAAQPIDDGAIRPPGAVAEANFLSACVRCGLCVQACPWHTLRLADAHDAPVAVGTPYFRARKVPCEMCADVPCQKVCPTGALAPTLARIEDARMGTAALSRPEDCFSFIGASRCDSCVQACPLKGRAITLEYGRTRLGGLFQPVVEASVCTGCGKCEKACIAQRAAITVTASRTGATAAPHESASKPREGRARAGAG